MRIAATYIAVILASLPAIANAEDVTWAYSGTVTSVLRNTIGMPSPVGEPVNISITFDPDTVVTYPNILFGGRYAMSGGNTSFSVQIGEHVNDSINTFRFDAVTPNCCASHDLYQFLSYDPPVTLMGINFPGFVENAIVSFSFNERFVPGPIQSNELPFEPPNPNHFRDARIRIIKRVGNNIVFSFQSDDLQIVQNAVPEPASFILVAVVAASGLAMCCRNNSRRHTPRTAPFFMCAS